MDMDLKIVLTLVVGNGVVLSVFYYAFTSKIKEIARHEARETREEFDIFESKIETNFVMRNAMLKQIRITHNGFKTIVHSLIQTKPTLITTIQC